MNIVQFAEKELKKKLSYCQIDLLETLEKDSDFVRILKPTFYDTRVVLDIYRKYKEHCERLVAV